MSSTLLVIVSLSIPFVIITLIALAVDIVKGSGV